MVTSVRSLLASSVAIPSLSLIALAGSAVPAYAASPGTQTFAGPDGGICEKVKVSGEIRTRCSVISPLSPTSADMKEQVGVSRVPLRPEWCKANWKKQTVHNSGRFGVCSEIGWKLVRYEIVNGIRTPIGQVKFANLQWIAFKREGKATWLHDSVIRSWELKGVYKRNGTGILIESLCAIRKEDWCSVTRRTVPGQRLIPVHEGMKFHAYYEEKSSLSPTVDLVGSIGVRFYTDGGYVTDTGSFQGKKERMHGRCDNKSNSGGCVNPKFKPILVFDVKKKPKVAAVARHIFDAQQKLPSHWGANKKFPDKRRGRPLTRLRDETKIDDNRRIACSGVKPSCDEFPFASTWQGAYYTPAHDRSSRTVPASANRSQGGIMSTFYQTNRMFEHDAFWVRVILKDGRASW